MCRYIYIYDFFFSYLIRGNHWHFNIPLMKNIALTDLWNSVLVQLYCSIPEPVSYTWGADNCVDGLCKMWRHAGCRQMWAHSAHEPSRPAPALSRKPQSRISVALLPGLCVKSCCGSMASGPVLAAQAENRACPRLSAVAWVDVP